MAASVCCSSLWNVCRCTHSEVCACLFTTSNKKAGWMSPEYVTVALRPQGRRRRLLRGWNIELYCSRVSSLPAALPLMTPFLAQSNYNGWESESQKQKKASCKNNKTKNDFQLYLHELNWNNKCILLSTYLTPTRGWETGIQDLWIVPNLSMKHFRDPNK